MTIIIPPLTDLWWVEPCAGSGNILRQMPVDRRIGYDINPQDNGEFGIIQADYRTQRLDPAKLWAMVTNPAFRKQPGDPLGGPQTAFEWAAGQPCVVAVGIIAPHWFQRHTIENRLCPYFHRVHREILAPDSFLRDGQRKWSPAIFDVWVRRDYMREPLEVRDVHPDWEFLPAHRSPEAGAWMQHWGVGYGDIKSPDHLGRTKNPSSHWFIKERRPGTIDRLKRINWHEVAYPTLSSPRLHKDEVVGAYIAAYGEPEAPDYDPEVRGAGEEATVPAARAPTPPAAHPEDMPPLVEADAGDLEFALTSPTVWIGRRAPNMGVITDGGAKRPVGTYGIRCSPEAVAILRSIAWAEIIGGAAWASRDVADADQLYRADIVGEYTRAKAAARIYPALP